MTTRYVGIGNRPDGSYRALADDQKAWVFYSADLDQYIDFWKGEFVWADFPTFYTLDENIDNNMTNEGLDKLVKESVGWGKVMLVPTIVYFCDLPVSKATSVYMDVDFTQATAAL